MVRTTRMLQIMLVVCEALTELSFSIFRTLLQACNDSVNPSVFVDTTAIGVGFLIGFVTLSLSIKFLGRRKVFGMFNETSNGLFKWKDLMWLFGK